MNTQPIETARDSDLRFSFVALHRAARRARELAAHTGTAIIIRQHGVILPISAAEDLSTAERPPASGRQLADCMQTEGPSKAA